MLALALLLVSQVFQASADPTPREPYSASVYNEGGDCTIIWDADPTGTWTTMNIQLMTGSNFDMVHLRTVATVDGTDPDTTTFTYPCVAVEPNSQIYFYQFTSPSSSEVLWTTRFTIADAEGNTVEPTEEETTGSGELVRYGVGALEDPSLVNEPPVSGNTPGGSETSTGTTTGPPATRPQPDDEDTTTSPTRRPSTRTSTSEQEEETDDADSAAVVVASTGLVSVLALVASTFFVL